MKIKFRNVFWTSLILFCFSMILGAQGALADSQCEGKQMMTPCTLNGTPNGGMCNSAGICVDPNYKSNTNTNTGTTKNASTAKNTGGSSTGSTNFTNPLNYKTVDQLLSGILSAIQKIIVMLALVFIVIGAVMILVSAGDSGMVEKGKKSITMALVGFAIGVAAPSILKELAGIIGWGGAPAALSLSQIAVRVLNFLLGTMGILALIMMVIGAIMYLTSAGDEDRANKGKDIFKYAMIGLVMAMASMVLVTQIAKFFA